MTVQTSEKTNVSFQANERLPVDAYYDSVEFLYRLLKALM
jgi:acetylornithine deacetylase/succinyl-diaminopimelate desuccinylase-like protein